MKAPLFWCAFTFYLAAVFDGPWNKVLLEIAAFATLRVSLRNDRLRQQAGPTGQRAESKPGAAIGSGLELGPR